MKEREINLIIESIDNALWDLKHNQCNVSTKEKGWETYYGLDDDLIKYIRKLEKQNKNLQQRIDKAIEYIKLNIRDIDYDTEEYDYLMNILKGEENE